METSNKIQIVIARYNEDISWTKELSNVLIYNKGEPIDTKCHDSAKISTLMNVGREGHTIYRHIYDNYENLEDYIVFLQGNPFDHSPNLVENIKKYYHTGVDFEWLSETIYETYVFDCPHHSGLPMRIVYNTVFQTNTLDNEKLEFGSGAQFIVSKQRIHQRPKEFYLNIIQLLEYSVNPIEGYVIERFHHAIFTLLSHIVKTKTNPGPEIIYDEWKDGRIPIIIICYNNYKYVNHMIEQLIRVNSDLKPNLYIMNNGSDDPETVEFLRNCAFTDIKILHRENNGPWIRPETNADLFERLPDKFILTDPDLELNANLPPDFVNVLCELSEKYEKSKVGFAISIHDIDKMYPYEYMKPICEWEYKYWIFHCFDEKYNNVEPYEIYHAELDTTFALINKKHWVNSTLRIAGDFTCRHLPFYINNGVMSLEDEYKYYKGSKFSTLGKVFFSYIRDMYDVVEDGEQVSLVVKCS